MLGRRRPDRRRDPRDVSTLSATKKGSAEVEQDGTQGRRGARTRFRARRRDRRSRGVDRQSYASRAGGGVECAARGACGRDAALESRRAPERAPFRDERPCRRLRRSRRPRAPRSRRKCGKRRSSECAHGSRRAPCRRIARRIAGGERKMGRELAPHRRWTLGPSRARDRRKRLLDRRRSVARFERGSRSTDARCSGTHAR